MEYRPFFIEIKFVIIPLKSWKLQTQIKKLTHE